MPSATGLTRRNLALLGAGVLLGLGIGCLVLFAFQGSFLVDRFGLAGSGPASIMPAVNASAPDFSLQSLSGEPLSLADLRGRAVLVNFWATWCGPCLEEMPLLQQAQEQHPEALVVLGINFDEPQDRVQAYVDDLGLTFTVLLDPGGEVNGLYRVRGYPSTFFIDAEGVIRYTHIGALRLDQLERYLMEIGVGE